MFKAPIIENPRYYKLVQMQTRILILLIFPYGWIMTSLDLPVWTITLLLLGYIGVVIAIFRNQKAVRKILNRKQLEINEDEIHLVNQKHDILSKWVVSPTDSIITNTDFAMPHYKFSDIVGAWRGDSPHNFLELRKGSEEVRFEFHLDSNYMRIQMQKILDHWIARGIPVKRI